MVNLKEASSQEDESLTDKSMEPVVAFHSRGTKMHNNCCKFLCQRRKLKNKGAIVVIINLELFSHQFSTLPYNTCI